MNVQYRQGDVLLIKVESLPSTAEKEDNENRIILAWGEATGHAHAIDALAAESFRADNERFVVINEETRLFHEEHAPIRIEPGVYKVVRQREFWPLGEVQYVYVDD